MTIFQKPNPPLIAAGIGFLIENFSRGNIRTAGAVLFTSSLIIWSYLELTKGVNWFRKLLGGIVLLMMLLKLFKSLS